MNSTALAAELTNDPETRGYAGMTDVEAAADLNTEYCTRNKTSLTGSQVLNAIDKAEFNSKTADQKQFVWNIVHLGEVNPFGIEADLMVDIFGGSSTTIEQLQVLRIESISRAAKLDLGHVRAGDVQRARAE